jgi:hypothetical protein
MGKSGPPITGGSVPLPGLAEKACTSVTSRILDLSVRQQTAERRSVLGRYIALLRGVNVGGKNFISMPELKRRLSENDYRSVITYINSGNIIFSREDGDEESYKAAFEALIAEHFGLSAPVVVISAGALRDAPRPRARFLGPGRKYKAQHHLRHPAGHAGGGVPGGGGPAAGIRAGGLLRTRYFLVRAARDLLPDPVFQSGRFKNIRQYHDPEREHRQKASAAGGR